MTSAHKISIVPPLPSFEPASYEPFDPIVDATLDQILSEQKMIESSMSMEDDWLENSRYLNRSSSGSPCLPTSHQATVVKTTAKKSPPSSFDLPPQTKSRRYRPAKRNITIVDFVEDPESVPETDYSQTDDVTVKKTIADEVIAVGKDSQVRDQNTEIFLETLSITNQVGSEAGKEEIVKSNSVPASQITDVTIAIDGRDEQRSPASSGFQDDAQIKRNMNEHAGDNINAVSEPEDPDLTEQDTIFASVDQSIEDKVLHFVASHPFMKSPVQPVSRAARHAFTRSLREKAYMSGMKHHEGIMLIGYVRRIYLELAGAPVEPVTASSEDPCFGKEYDEEESSPQRSRKRILSDTENTVSRKRSKGKLHSSEGLNIAQQPAEETDSLQEQIGKPASPVPSQEKIQRLHDGVRIAKSTESPSSALKVCRENNDSFQDQSVVIDLTSLPDGLTPPIPDDPLSESDYKLPIGLGDRAADYSHTREVSLNPKLEVHKSPWSAKNKVETERQTESVFVPEASQKTVDGRASKSKELPVPVPCAFSSKKSKRKHRTEDKKKKRSKEGRSAIELEIGTTSNPAHQPLQNPELRHLSNVIPKQRISKSQSKLSSFNSRRLDSDF
ncbi:hypothetical protein N7495_002763 [Penicillium taxi]|uniref:uncharacterized protein n=1 Tax=Penicillium taxi TaxID=168475 RepID=UPI002544DD83|nr:uncharacterized protein N7495_002763 [Penicillium taxi]KAJ5902235.1 hypothetical protein N7495_002763 [Penicillium taxi]